METNLEGILVKNRILHRKSFMEDGLNTGYLWTQRKWCCHYKMKSKDFPNSGSVLCLSEH